MRSSNHSRPLVAKPSQQNAFRTPVTSSTHISTSLTTITNTSLSNTHHTRSSLSIQGRSFSSSKSSQGASPSFDSPSAINPNKKPVKIPIQKKPPNASSKQQQGKGKPIISDKMNLSKTNPQSSSSSSSMGGQSKKKMTLTEVAQRQENIRKNNLEELFRHSKMNNVFSGDMNHPSFFSRLEDGDTVYLNGTRRVTDMSGYSEVNFSMVARTIDKTRRAFIDRVVAYDYESELPFEQYLTTQLDETLSTATAIDRDQETGEPISRAFIRLRGEPWRWHSAVSIARVEPRLEPGMSQELVDSLPETTLISRFKFTENGLIAEKVVKHKDEIVFTVVDDLRITSAKAWNAKAEKIFEDSRNRLSEEFQEMIDSHPGPDGKKM